MAEEVSWLDAAWCGAFMPYSLRGTGAVLVWVNRPNERDILFASLLLCVSYLIFSARDIQVIFWRRSGQFFANVITACS